jgi:hypothetical protein
MVAESVGGVVSGVIQALLSLVNTSGRVQVTIGDSQRLVVVLRV